MMTSAPPFIETDSVLQFTESGPCRLVDLSDRRYFDEGHIPGAVHLDYSALTSGQKPSPGLLPDKSQLQQLAGQLGLHPDLYVIAYDNQGGGRAGRLLWTLHFIGHRRVSVVNGGMAAWIKHGLPTSSTRQSGTQGSSTISIAEDSSVLATRNYVLTHLDNDDIVLLDARSPAEFSGTDVRAARGGHIPGARNLNWLETINHTDYGRLHPDSVLRTLLAERGISANKEVVVYCQTHHRSAHTYVMLKHLGYERVRGYAGSWSEWGNDPTSPVA